ncbi:MAG: helix-turn-helix domain-containing protein, partial [Thermoplasmata archaeon]|nr:helix-turn-helix domain-containing protein [Thermoplasmata archaeon]
IHDLEFIGNMEILSIVGSEGNKHTCIVKGYESYSELDLDLIYTTPSMISEDRIIVSFIGAQQNLMKFVEMVRSHVGEIKNISFKKAAYQKQDILTILTGKQREVLAAAYEHGYYDIPRRISSERLSEKVKISKPTLIEHLRKAERRILAEIMAGHS